MEGTIFGEGLDRNPANYQPLTPLKHLQRAAGIFPDHVAIIHGSRQIPYSEFYARSRKLASALRKAGVERGDTVAAMLSNTPPMLEAHHGVPMAGGVLLSINTRLDADIIAFQLDHGEAKVVLVDREFAGVMASAIARAEANPLVINYDDPEYPDDAPFPKGAMIGDLEYEDFIAGGDPDSTGRCRKTSGTRSRSTIRRGRPATRRAWSTTIAARR
jgi:fatty-acyl-CoA synthase